MDNTMSDKGENRNIQQQFAKQVVHKDGMMLKGGIKGEWIKANETVNLNDMC